MSIKIAINGFGRIGRNVLRALLERTTTHDIEVVAVNDLAAPEVLMHLLRYDSVHGTLSHECHLGENVLVVNGMRIPFQSVIQRNYLGVT